MSTILENNDVIINALLRMSYRSAVKNRCKKDNMIRIPEGITKKIAHELDHPRLARLFIRSQFYFMTIDFCRKHFNRLYPPCSVVFGGNCWKRYERYVERGINDGS
ncbi:hypothetical protein LCGC14_2024740 [marine sediment metagenome]|uniref:Uncharacterized protein n=1 Tax=marine sediment metagenome TaxID=412755 RepID=A0A0F9HTJ0_9ZZZZ